MSSPRGAAAGAGVASSSPSGPGTEPSAVAQPSPGSPAAVETDASGSGAAPGDAATPPSDASGSGAAPGDAATPPSDASGSGAAPGDAATPPSDASGSGAAPGDAATPPSDASGSGTAPGTVTPSDATDSGPDAAARPPTDEADPAGSSPELTPLPAAPPREDPSSLRQGSWRGRGWFQIRLDLVAPVAGERPGRGNVTSASGGVQAGWRPLPRLGFGVGLSTFLHDKAAGIAVDSEGGSVEVSDFGRLTLFDVGFVRLFVPTRGRVEPRFDLGAVVGIYRAPWADDPKVVAGARGGVGADVWLGPTFSLEFSVDPRLIVVDGAAGLTLQAGVGATIHW